MSAAARPYDYDPAKATSNLRTHRLSFDDGFRVLQVDPTRCLDLIDDLEDYDEERWVRIGPHPAVPLLLIHVT